MRQRWPAWRQWTGWQRTAERVKDASLWACWGAQAHTPRPQLKHFQIFGRGLTKTSMEGKYTQRLHELMTKELASVNVANCTETEGEEEAVSTWSDARTWKTTKGGRKPCDS
jgi:hypothetical protein